MLVLLVVFSVIRGIKDKKRVPVVRIFPTTITITSNSSLPHIELMSKIIAYDILEYDTLTVMIITMRKEIPAGEDGFTIDAFIIKSAAMPHAYVISLSSRVKLLPHLRRVLSHEFAHINQMETGQMRIIDEPNGIYSWEGKVIDLKTMPWSDRPMEIDAQIVGRNIEHQVNKLLYAQ